MATDAGPAADPAPRAAAPPAEPQPPGQVPAPGSAAAAPKRFGALRHRDFSLLWSGLLLSNSGTWMQNAGQAYLIHERLNPSPLALGVLAASVGLPMLLLPAFGGVVADRVQRLALLRVTNVLWIVMMGVLATLTWSGTVTYWQIIAVSFLSSCTLAFDNPTRQALIPDLVPRSELLSAISLNSVAFTGASLVGPALAGAIITAFGQDVYRGTAVVFYLNTLSYLAVLVPVLFWIRAPERERPGTRASIGEDLKEGFGYVKQRRPLVLLLVLTAVTNVFGRSFSQLMPVFSKDVLHVGADGLGLMYSAPGAGTLAAGTALAALAHGGGRRHLISGATVAFTVAIFAFALSRSFLLSLALLFVTGLTSTAAQATISTLLQAKVPGRLRGRVMSLQTLAIIGMGPLGGLFSGALATIVPAPVAVSASAAVILVVLAAILATQPAWRDVDVDRDDD